MEEPQPGPIVPPRTRIPQIPPHFVEANRRLYIAPRLHRYATLPSTPMPQPCVQYRVSYNALMLMQLPMSQLSPIQQQYVQRLWAYGNPGLTQASIPGQISPAMRLPANLRRPARLQHMPDVPVTPGYSFMQWSPVRGIQEDITTRRSYSGIPVTPPCSIPGYFVKDENERSEPGFGETLMGCGMLLLLGVIVVAVLYYLVM